MITKYLSRFWLAFSVFSIISALGHLSLVAVLIVHYAFFAIFLSGSQLAVYWRGETLVPIRLDDDCVHDLVEGGFPSPKRVANWFLVAEGLYAAHAVALDGSITELCGVVSTVAYMSQPFPVDSKVVYTLPFPLSVLSVYDVSSDAKSTWDMLDIPPSHKIHVF